MKSVRATAKLDAHLLESVLKGDLSWRQALRHSAPATRTDGVTPVNTVIGFVPNTDLPTEILLTTVPPRGSMIPTASLARRLSHWVASPQIVKADRLQECAVVEIERHDWMATLVALAEDLRIRGDWRSVDWVPWAIAAAWPDWEREGYGWEQRARDLATRMGTVPLAPNTLLVKCRRLGLIRVTKQASSVTHKSVVSQ